MALDLVDGEIFMEKVSQKSGRPLARAPWPVRGSTTVLTD